MPCCTSALSCRLQVAKAHHARMCRKTPLCIYCAQTFASLAALEAHKPRCKEQNWRDHPLRLLQHDLAVPDSSLTWVQRPSRPAAGRGAAGSRGASHVSSLAQHGRRVSRLAPGTEAGSQLALHVKTIMWFLKFLHKLYNNNYFAHATLSTV